MEIDELKWAIKDYDDDIKIKIIIDDKEFEIEKIINSEQDKRTVLIKPKTIN